MIDAMEEDYQKSIKVLAPTINMMSQHVPQRRKRKLHIGLFGYTRESGSVQLPRAIKFCASLYSLGLPPDVLGLSVVSEQDVDKIRESYSTIDSDMKDALQYLNTDNLDLFGEAIKKKVLKVAGMFQFDVNQEHQQITTAALQAFKKKNGSALQEQVIAGARVRKFLG